MALPGYNPNDPNNPMNRGGPSPGAVVPTRQRPMFGDSAISGQQRQTGLNSGQGFQRSLGQSGQARHQQMTALGLQRDAALGNTPSRAELLGHQMTQDALEAQLAGAASGRGGPMAQAAATRNAQQGAAAYAQHSANDLAALRAQEMAGARDAYANTAGGIRGQDFAGAGLYGQDQLAHEQMANDLAKAQAGIDLQGQLDDSANWRATRALNEQHWESQAGLNQHRTDKNTDIIGGLISGIGGAAAGLLSDPRSKTGVQDLSAPMGSHAPWMPAQSDVDFIRYGQNADPAMLDQRYSQQANPPAPFLQSYMSSQDEPLIPTGREADNIDEAAKIRAGFAADKQLEDSQAQWGRSFGSPDQASAGARDQPMGGRAKPSGPSRFGAALSGAVSGFGSGSHISDPDSKAMLSPLSPISGPAQATFAGPQGLQGGSVGGEYKAHSDFATQFQRNAGAGPVAISDPSAKRAAFEAGAQYADADHAGVHIEPPDYMKTTREMKSFQRQDAGKAGAAIRLATDARARDKEADRLGAATGPNRFDTPIVSGPIVYPAPLIAGVRLGAAMDKATADRQWADSLGPVQGPPAPPPAPPPGQLAQAAPPPLRPSPKTYIEMPEQDRMVSDPRAKTMEGPSDMPSVFYGADGLAYAASPNGPVPLEPKPREMKSFSRDTPAQQRAVKDKYYSDVARRADEAIAALQSATSSPSSVAKTAARDTSGDAFVPEANDPRIAAPAQMMDEMGGGKSFRYRPGVPGEDPTKVHFGTTTEDLKRTPMGASMVVDGGPETAGYDAIDVKEAVGPTLASLANLNQRLRALEAPKSRGRRGR